MRKFFQRALLSAAVIGLSGLANADEFTVISLPGDLVSGESKPYEVCQDDSIYQPVCDCCDQCVGNWHDNTVIFAGADVYKSIGERVTNIAGGPGALTSSFGGVIGFNTGFALGDSELRGQFGASYGVYDPKGRLAIVPQNDAVEQQQFVTAGVYKRGDMLRDCDPLSYGVVVDGFFADNWGVNANGVNLGQVRGIMGYALSKRTEIGAYGSFYIWDDTAQVTVAGGGPLSVIRAANQLNGFLRYNTDFGGSLMGYVGGFDQSDVQQWQFGLTGQAPLSHNWALYGNFNYAVPDAPSGAGGSGTEQYNVQFGLAYYFGGKAVSRSVTGQRGLPLLNVANNGSFLITD